MSNSGKKKPSDNKDTNKDVAKTVKSTSVKPATKKPASFSRTPREAKKVVAEKVDENKVEDKKVAEKKIEEKKATQKKTTQKKTTEKKIEDKKPLEKKVEEKKTDDKKEIVNNFAEFETLKIDTNIKSQPKIVVRDVAKDKLAEKEAKIAPDEKSIPEDEAATENKNTSEEKTAEEVVKEAMREAGGPAVVMPEPKIDMTRVKEQVKARNAKRVKAPRLQVKIPASEIKNHEIEKAIKNASSLPAETKHSRERFHDFGWKRVVLAFCCAATAIFAIVYFINSTSTDISLKVAAMQSGIDASYPSYVPRGYNLSDVTSSSGKITMNFKSDDGSFGISEESSAWDSNALLNNYIKENYDENYSVVREQGLTLYMGNDWEVWVNGGVLYKLTVDSGTLTKKQMKSIAVSL